MKVLDFEKILQFMFVVIIQLEKETKIFKYYPFHAVITVIFVRGRLCSGVLTMKVLNVKVILKFRHKIQITL